MIRFEILGDPVGKGRPRATKKGNFVQIYTPDKTLDYENYVKYCFAESGCKPYMNDEELCAAIFIYQSIPKSVSKKKKQEMLSCEIRPKKKPDIDNVLKIVFDALNNVAYKDDTQIVSLTASKDYSDTPKVVVNIWSYLEVK